MPRASSTCCACSARCRPRRSARSWLSSPRARTGTSPDLDTREPHSTARRRSTTSHAPTACCRSRSRASSAGPSIEDAAPAARCPRGAPADRRAERVPRPGRRPARRPGQPLRPHPRAVPGHGCRGPARARRRDRARRAAPARAPTAASSRASSARAPRHPNGATPRCCAACARRSPRGPALTRSSRSPQRALGRFLPDWQHVGVRRRHDGGGCAGRWPGERDRPARRGRAAGIRLGVPRAAQPRARLQPGDARRAHRHGRGDLGRARRAARRRRLAQPAPGRHRAADPGRAEPRRTERAARAHPRWRSTGGGAYFFRQLSAALAPGGRPVDDIALATALWDLVWAGLVSNDTLAPLRARLGATDAPERARRPAVARTAAARVRHPSRNELAATAPPTVAGRWSLLPRLELAPPRARTALAETLLERHGVVTRGAVMSEGVAGGFALAYKVLSGFEETGRTRRGYFIERLGAAQFATPRDGRPAARLRPRSASDRAARAAAARSHSPRPTRRTPTARPALARPDADEPARATARAARRARSWCWSTAPSRCTSSAAARACWTSSTPTTRHAARGGGGAVAGRARSARAAAQAARREVNGEFSVGTAARRRPGARPASPRPRRGCGCEPRPRRPCLRATPSTRPRGARTRRWPGGADRHRLPRAGVRHRRPDRRDRARGGVSRGKHLLHRSATWTLHTHLKMEGAWRLVPRRASGGGNPAYQARAVLRHGDVDRGRLRARHHRGAPARRGGRRRRAPRPRPARPDWDAAPRPCGGWRRTPDVPVVVAVLDQRNLAGIGNVYANELCFLRGMLRPARWPRSTTCRRSSTWRAGCCVANRDRCARHDGRHPPRPQTWVYGRRGQPCRRCGTILARRRTRPRRAGGARRHLVPELPALTGLR